MEVIGFLLILGLALYTLNLRSRIEELSDRLTLLERKQDKTPVAAPEPIAPPPIPPLPIPPPPIPQKIVVEPVRRPEPVFKPVPVAAAVAALPEPEGPTLGERLRTALSGEEWEALIGGSILNKIGALVLVIGIALFLGFSFAHITPAGRAAMALSVSLGILGAGVWTERRERYRIFARGLIGAGWAALYATAYAIYAIPAARIVDNPFAGSLILLAVGAGMVLHSLRYRAQALTGVAYFSAFAALAVTPSSPFAVVSLIPLAASILYLAARFDWYPMALFGLIATYGTCISRGSSGAPLAEVQALFVAYWLLFDAFDLLRVKRRIVRGGVEWIYYGNLIGFAGLSYIAWAHHQPERLWFASACGAALFAADAIVRALLRPPSSFTATDGLGERLEAGSFEASTLVSAVLAAASLVANVAGVWLIGGLAVEAEVLYLLGVRFVSPFLRYLGIAAFAHSLVRVGLTPWGEDQTPVLVFHALLFYVNRVVRRPNPLMSSAAAAVVAMAIAIETPVAYLGAAWIAAAFVLFEIGLRAEALDFRVQAYVVATAGMVASLVRGDTPGLSISFVLVFATAVQSRWFGELEERVDLAVATSGASVALAFVLLWHAVPVEYVALSWFAVAYAVLELGNAKAPEEMRWFAAPAGAAAGIGLVATHSLDFAKFPTPAVSVSWFGAAALSALCALRIGKSGAFRQAFTAAAAALAMAGAFLVTPEPYVSLAWSAIAVAVLELGFREIAMAAFVPVFVRLLGFDLERTALISMPVPIAAIYWLWYRVRQRGVFWVAPIPLLALVWRLAEFSAPPAFALIALIMLSAGIHFRMRDARIQAYLVAGLALTLSPFADSLWLSAATVVLLYAGQALAHYAEEPEAPAAFSVGATLLLSWLLFDRISGGMLTVSWGFEGLALLAAGFTLRERVLRIEGLGMLLVCILKLFIYDLRNLETLPRILSFIALGAIMLGVSWIYTRFRSQLRKLL
jgi:uncharacterized membrane protein